MCVKVMQGNIWPHRKVYQVCYMAKRACSMGLSGLESNKVGVLKIELALSVETSCIRF